METPIITRGRILLKLDWSNPELDLLTTLATQNWRRLLKKGFGDGIMLTQKHFMTDPDIPDPYWRATHVEMLVDHDKDGNARPFGQVWTASQEEVFKLNVRTEKEFLDGLTGKQPKYILLKTSWEEMPEHYNRYMRVVMIECCKLWKLGKSKVYPVAYDIGQIPMYLLNLGWNSIRKLFGKPWHHYAWTEIKGLEVCSSRIAGLIRWALQKGLSWWHKNFIWPQKQLEHSADIAPGHFCPEIAKKLIRVMA